MSNAPTLDVTLNASPTATEAVLQILQTLAAQSGIITDANVGSQVRAFATGVGATIEQQSIATQVAMAQYAIQGAFAIFGITPISATYSSGNVTFSLGYTATSTVYVPVNTQLSTTGGIQFYTTQAVQINSGSSSVGAPVQSAAAGSNSNVTANSITQIVTTLPYPLTVTNSAPTSGGQDQETFSATLSRFNNLAATLGRSTPQSIASSVYGTTYNGETVKYSTVYEPWRVQAASGLTSGFTVGYDVYIDNGTGTASSNLITAVSGVLSGAIDYGPAGVPYNVYAVAPTTVSIIVNATSTPSFSSVISTITSAIQTSVEDYFASLNFGDSFQNGQLYEAISNNTYGWLSSLTVSNTPTGNSISPAATSRIILSGLTINVTAG